MAENIAEDLILNLLTMLMGKEEIANALNEKDISASVDDQLSEFPNYISQLQDYTLSEIDITENNQTYTPGEKEAYIKAHVEISFDNAPTTWPKEIDQNGEYHVDDENTGWNEIDVNVQHNTPIELYITNFEPVFGNIVSSENVIIGSFEPTYCKTYSTNDIMIGTVEVVNYD